MVILLCGVTLRSEQLLPNLLKKWKLSSVKLIRKLCSSVRGLSLDRRRSSKLIAVSLKTVRTAENVERFVADPCTSSVSHAPYTSDGTN